VESTVSVNRQYVFRGLHANPFDKKVTCIHGRILDIIVSLDPSHENYLKPQYYTLDPRTELFEVMVRSHHAHGFLSLEENSILVYHFNGYFTPENTRHIHYRDPWMGITLPIQDHQLHLSEKDMQKNFYKPVDYLVWGGRGFLGSHVIFALKDRSKHFIESSVRLEKTKDIAELLDLYSPRYVINAAGLTGVPNIFWCDEHPTETVETNITYQMTMAAMCHDRDIHLTVLGSGGIFLNDGEYGEEDRGNFTENFYARARILLEEMMSLYPNVLYLRVNYPISSRASPKNLLTKLIGYSSITDITLSVTCVDNLFPILLDMVEKRETGICNFVNPGVVSLVDMMRLYQQKHPDHTFVIKEVPSMDAKRSSPNLRVQKLLPFSPLPAIEAVRQMVQNYPTTD
jgi:dTDP-4-dehydrorhamnose 3,5-epimerase-like enzyme/dTDP-4-dehydrorhamnose reductase